MLASFFPSTAGGGCHGGCRSKRNISTLAAATTAAAVGSSVV